MSLRLFQGNAKFAINYYVWKPIKKLLSWLYLTWFGSLMKTTKNKIIEDDKPPPCFEMMTIGTVQSVYKEKFGTPRQGNLVPHGRGCVVFDKRAVDPIWSLDSLDQFSHVWLVFVFHANTNVTGKPTPVSKVRPPQGAGAKIGVFATRSPHRPNPIGLTLARIRSIDLTAGTLFLDGLDLCEGTPILDIKPYCEHVDWPGENVATIPDWVTNPKFDRAPVTFSDEALRSLKLYVDEQGTCTWYQKGESDVVKQAIEEIISLDPRDLNRGRGTFNTDVNNTNGGGEARMGISVKETSFTRREEKIRSKAAVRPIYVRFDELDITFRPADDDSRAFHVVAIDLFNNNKTSAGGKKS